MSLGLRSSAARRAYTCTRCQWQLRALSTTTRQQFAAKPPTPEPSKEEAKKLLDGGVVREKPDPTLPGAAIHAPRSYGQKLDKFNPEVLPRPIGLSRPPHPHDNTGIDNRTIKQRRDDFVNYEKHLARRKDLKQQFARPYFRDWTNMKFHDGKSFLAPPRPFRSDASLFFPNFVGDTLLKEKGQFRDTTNVLHGKTTVVAMFSSKWADDQVKTFIGEDENPALHALMSQTRDQLQVVRLNVEENSVKAWLVSLFMGGLRREMGPENWDKYFLVKQGVTDEIRESIGLLNSKVGYVYLVDHLCRIRWAASGDARPDEKESLIKSAGYVLDEFAQDQAALGAMRAAEEAAGQ